MYNVPSIADYDPSTLDFGVTSELFESRVMTEDGHHMEGSMVYVTATTEDGVVFARLVGCADWEYKGFDDEFGIDIIARTADPVELNEKAGFMATKLTMKDAPRLNPTAWQYYRAIYGSRAYDSLGIEAETAAEERRELRGY